ncbi:hypothetical protein E2562_006895 [Oryza meyeriana var. granulata]|uniref:Uncharacterized protein n=1 Tax=Oryza meyeriana var. granulata TaxID=110450 RepID=A0A6G1BKN3_9ORYZ|nr:hypothetical protein E2562_006895 [Oryza meyeriana var. granulata]
MNGSDDGIDRRGKGDEELEQVEGGGRRGRTGRGAPRRHALRRASATTVVFTPAHHRCLDLGQKERREESDALRAANLPGRGRRLLAMRNMREGEVILMEQALLLYPASLASLPFFCSACFHSFCASASPRSAPRHVLPPPPASPLCHALQGRRWRPRVHHRATLGAESARQG